MARLYFASFWCIFFTGAVRKWLFPGVSAFYLLQDVPIFFAYLYALQSGLYSKGLIFFGILALSAVLALQTLLQVVGLGLNGVVAVIGLHHYLFYLPMLAIFPLSLTETYRRNFIRWNLRASIPMCVLAIAQSRSPVNAWVNRTSQGDAMGLPGADVARVTGTFNFATFLGIWAGMALSFCFGEWLLEHHRRSIHNRWVLILSTLCLSIIPLISGSRQVVLLCVLSLIGALIAAAMIRSVRVIIVTGAILLSLPCGALLTSVIAPTESAILQERFFGKSGSQDAQERVAGTFYSFLTQPKFSLIGRGIGMGVDASHFMSEDAYNFTYDLSEADTTRNVMELGTPVGLLYLTFRFSFMVAMIILSFYLVRSSPHVLPLAFVLFGQVMADLTRNATMTSTQVMICYAFILGVQIYPGGENSEVVPSS